MLVVAIKKHRDYVYVKGEYKKTDKKKHYVRPWQYGRYNSWGMGIYVNKHIQIQFKLMKAVLYHGMLTNPLFI